MIGDENILQVTFEEEKEEKITAGVFYNYSDVYQRVAHEGIMLGLRRYQFLGMFPYARVTIHGLP